jgi:hypothetical protein
VVPLPAVNQVRAHVRTCTRACLFCLKACPCLHPRTQRNVHTTPPPHTHTTQRKQQQVMTICKILEGILPKESVRGAPPPDKKLLEYHFVFACIWAFGGCMLVDKVRWQLGRRCGEPPSGCAVCPCDSANILLHVLVLPLARPARRWPTTARSSPSGGSASGRRSRSPRRASCLTTTSTRHRCVGVAARDPHCPTAARARRL